MYDLDLKNKKLLAELEMNARASYSELAKKIGMSKQVVKYRIEKLEEDNIIQGYNAIIDVNKLNHTIYLIYLKLIKISSTEEKEWIKEINEHPNVALTAKNAGQWDLTIVIICKNNQELDSILKIIAEDKLVNIKEKLITSEIEGTYFNLKLLFPQAKEVVYNTANQQEKPDLYDEDLIIINELAKDCKISLIDLSKKVNMSPNGIKDKIRRLEQKKIIIVYKTKINYEKLGYLHFRVHIFVDKFTIQLYKHIKEFLKSKGNVESISRYMGYSDIDFRCYSKNVIEFYELISEIKDVFVQNIIGIDSVLVFGWKRIKYYPK